MQIKDNKRHGAGQMMYCLRFAHQNCDLAVDFCMPLTYLEAASFHKAWIMTSHNNIECSPGRKDKANPQHTFPPLLNGVAADLLLPCRIGLAGFYHPCPLWP